MHIGLPQLHPLYVIPVLAALLLGLFFPVNRHLTDSRRRRQYLFLQLVTFLSAIVGAKLAFLVGEYHWPLVRLESWGQVFDSGRSIVGALVLGFLGAELAKRLIHYPLPPNDRLPRCCPLLWRSGGSAAGCKAAAAVSLATMRGPRPTVTGSPVIRPPSTR